MEKNIKKRVCGLALALSSVGRIMGVLVLLEPSGLLAKAEESG